MRHIRSNLPILIQTLGGDDVWNNMGTSLGGVMKERGTDRPWLTTDPVTGTVPPYSSRAVQITLDATGLQPGSHSAEIIVWSSDPDRSSASVPVEMTVLPHTTYRRRCCGATSWARNSRPAGWAFSGPRPTHPAQRAATVGIGADCVHDAAPAQRADGLPWGLQRPQPLREEDPPERSLTLEVPASEMPGIQLGAKGGDGGPDSGFS